MILPILFIFFNRAEIALKAFDRIKQVQPSRLFLASDGPRSTRKGEDVIVNKLRKEILGRIDWDCEVHTLFQSENLGCGRGVYTAINWFFSKVEEGIILEDDCVANPSFFKYSEELLAKYRDDTRIGMIAGTNPIKDFSAMSSIIFSKYKSCWGWATWRRAWSNMDISMEWLKSPYARDILKNMGYEGRDVDIWEKKIQYIRKGYVSAWDWQWYFSLAAQNQLCIYPSCNLISNIGDDDSATHTSFSSITIPSSPMQFPMSYPQYILPNYTFDKKFYLRSRTLKSRLSRVIPHSIKGVIKHILKSIR